VTAAVLTMSMAGPATGAEHQERSRPPLDVQLLSIADYHGSLVPTNSTIDGPDGDKILVGGGPYLASHLDRLSAGKRNSFRFTAGDSISSSPAYDQWHGSEPTIEFLNHIGIEFNNVGNHELDVSPEYLVDHIWHGRCLSDEPDVDGCFVDSAGKTFAGSNFPHSTANIVLRRTLEPFTPPYVIREVRAPGGPPVSVAFLNLTFQHNGDIETQSHQPTLLGLDMLETANTYAQKLDRMGVKTIVAAVHEGGEQDGPFNGCVNPRGPLIDFARDASPLIDVIVGGHTHRQFNCVIDDPDGNPRPVVQPGMYGQLINETTLRIDRATKDVVRSETTSVNHPVTRDVDPDPVVVAMGDYWLGRQRQTAVRPVAEIAGDFTRAADHTGQSTLGNAAADAMYEDSQEANEDPAARADLAMVPVQVFQGSSPFLGDLSYEPGASPSDAPGVVLFEEWQQAFGYRNPVVTVTVTGADLHEALEGQWRPTANGGEMFRPFAVSGNVRYSADPGAPIGDRVDPADVLIDGTPLRLDQEYRLAALTYNLWGRDGHAPAAEYSDPVRGSIDRDAFLQYLNRHSPARPPALDRIVLTSD
jgi:5'-nucleotidase